MAAGALLAGGVIGMGVRAPAAHAALGAPLTAAFFDSEAGDDVGGGAQLSFGSVQDISSTPGYVDLYVISPQHQYRVDIASPPNTDLAVGTYENAVRAAFRGAGQPGLDVNGGAPPPGGGVGCNTVAGRFIVDDVAFSGTTLVSFSARFEQHCDGAAPALFGAVSFNSTADYRARSVSPTSLSFPATVPGSRSATQTVTITDNGPSDLAVTTVTLAGANPGDFTKVSDTCAATTLHNAQSCAVGVAFAPTKGGTRTASLVVADDIAPTGRHIGLSGVGSVPGVGLSASSLSFGFQRVGTFGNPQTLTVTNTGTGPVTFTRIAAVGAPGGEFFGTTTCFAQPVAPSRTCTITSYMQPVHLGTRSATLTIYDNAPGGPQRVPMSGVGTEGYYMVTSTGGLAGFGDALDEGAISSPLNKPVVGMTTTPNGDGYWMTASDGGIFPFGNAAGYGSTGGIHLNKPIVGMAATPDGGGYWLVASDGGIFPFGDAGGYGSTGGIHLNQPIVGMAVTPDGGGYWLVASDGGIFPFGDAGGYGSTGGIHLNKPIVGMAATPDGGGYWLVASDGGIFPFGDAGGYGSTGGIHLNQPIIAMAAAPDGGGYWLVASDGGIFPFGDAPGYGSLGGQGVTDVVGVAGTAPPVTVPPLVTALQTRLSPSSWAGPEPAPWRHAG